MTATGRFDITSVIDFFNVWILLIGHTQNTYKEQTLFLQCGPMSSFRWQLELKIIFDNPSANFNIALVVKQRCSLGGG